VSQLNYQSVADMVADLEARPVEATGHIYHPIPFPEFENLRVSANREVVEQKGRRIREIVERRRSLGLPASSVIDIGANAGYFTFSLARIVESVTAYEPNERYSSVGASLAQLRAPNVDWRSRAFTYEEFGDESWDIALMLSTFQWMTNGDENLAEGFRTLRRLSEVTQCLIFELGLNHGKSTVTTGKRNHVAAIHRMLREHTTYPVIAYVGSGRLWPARRAWRGWRHMFVCSHDDPATPEARARLLKRLPV
jgi:SAM-dependent methyltransferase